MIPSVEYGKNDKDTIANLMDAMQKIKKEMNFILYHLDEENIPSLSIIKGDIDGLHTSITQTDASITLLAGTVGGQQSQINVMSESISLKVSYGDVVSAINLSPETISINANKINLNGVTTMNGLAKINGGVELGDPTVASGKYIRFNNQASIRTGSDLGTLEISVSTSLNVYGSTIFNNRPTVGGVQVALVSDQVAKFG